MLQKIIYQLTENDYSLLSLQMKEAKADKYLALLNNYRKNKIADQELIILLNVKPAAFYTLKSRLADKVQFFLFNNVNETRVKLIQNVAKIDHLVYNTPRETSIQILKQLEVLLTKYDMPNELIIVYKALKKLHLHSPKHFDYSQLYNKHVAYNLAQDNAEDLLSSFCKILSEYYLSRNEQELTKLVLIKKEMEKVCRLYQSHRLKVYENILNIHFALFLSDSIKTNEDATIESMLTETLEIFETYKEDKVYKYLIQVIHFLYFEYYHQLKLHKNARIYFDKIEDKSETLPLFNHSCFAPHYLIFKIEYAIENSKPSNLSSKNNISEEEPNVENIPNFVLFNYYKAAISFYEGHYLLAIQRLNKLIREISFKNISFSEVETKLFLAMLYFFNKEGEHAAVILRNVTRKINEEKENEKFRNALLFIKLLKSIGKERGLRSDEKNAMLFQHFKAVNSGRYKILEILELNDGMLAKMKLLSQKN